MNDAMKNLPAPTWAPSTLREAHLASNLNIAIKEGVGRHHTPPEIHAIIAEALIQTGPTLNVRLHEVLVRRLGLDRMRDAKALATIFPTFDEMMAYTAAQEKTTMDEPRSDGTNPLHPTKPRTDNTACTPSVHKEKAMLAEHTAAAEEAIAQRHAQAEALLAATCPRAKNVRIDVRLVADEEFADTTISFADDGASDGDRLCEAHTIKTQACTGIHSIIDQEESYLIDWLKRAERRAEPKYALLGFKTSLAALLASV